jgi:NAD(P)-dependent dehydrogenase (short-subunit alcohol dehydrogenase family)
MSKVWFITGSSRGLGRRFAEAALARGDRVAAAARNTDHLAELAATYGDRVLPLALDVTDKAAVSRVIAQAHAHFGRLDVVANNAGTALIGMVEELPEADVRAQFETNLFGSLWVIQAALPYLRAQGSGHILNFSSLLGLASFPSTGGYSAVKAAVEALSDSLAAEVAGFGIKVTLVEPGPFSTDFAANATYPAPLEAYAGVRATATAGFATMPNYDPVGVGGAMLKIVDAPAPPARIFLGEYPLQVVPQIYADRIKGWQEWAGLSAQAGSGKA